MDDAIIFTVPPTTNQFGRVVTRVDISKVRANFSEMLDRALAGEIIIITRYGKDRAAMGPMDLLPHHLIEH